MKKPEEYLENAVNRLHDSEQPYLDENVYDGKLSPIIQAIKAAQEDAIRETVKECAKTAKLQKASDYGNFNKHSAKWEDTKDTTHVEMSYGHGDCGYTAVRTNVEAILSVADKLIKEL
jgi:hypothetical protein